MFAAGGGKLEVLPLGSAEVQGWVALARPGSELKWAPTVFRVRGASVRRWQGPVMGLRLAAHLGPRTSIRVLRALGAERRAGGTLGAAEPAGRGTSRRRFLELGAGGVVAAGILMVGAAPASADPVTSWLEKHHDQLPRTYPEIVALPEAYRRAVYQLLTPTERSAAWVTQLTSYRPTIPPKNREQGAVVDEALALAGDSDNFTGEQVAPSSTAVLADRSIAAFGVERARDIFGRLGAADGQLAPAATCSCSTSSDYCGGRCRSGGCTPLSPGCGFLYQYTCNGRCV